MSIPSFFGNNNTNATANGGTTTLPLFLQDNDTYCQETNTTTLPAFLRNSNQTTQPPTILPNFLQRLFLTNTSNINDPTILLLDKYMKGLKDENKKAVNTIRLTNNKRKIQDIKIVSVPKDIFPKEILVNIKGQSKKNKTMEITISLSRINVLVTDARYLKDVGLVLINKLASLETSRRQRYLQILMNDVSLISLDTLLADNANIIFKEKGGIRNTKLNFNDEQSAITARVNEINERKLKNVDTFENTKQAMFEIMLRVIQDKLNGVLRNQGDNTNSNYKTVSKVANDAIENGYFDGIIMEKNPFQQPIAPISLKQLIPEDDYKKCTEDQQITYKYIEQSSLSQKDIDDWEQDNKQKGQPPLLNQPIVRCKCCGKQFRYTSLSMAMRDLFTKSNFLVKHLLECNKFRFSHPIDYAKLWKRNGKAKAWLYLHNNIEAVTGLSANILPVVPLVYDHEVTIKKAKEIADEPIDNNNTPRHEDHVPISEIYQRPGIIKLIKILACISLISSVSAERKKRNGEYDSVEFYVKLFQELAGVNVNTFREGDWEYMFDKYGASQCSTLMYIYSMRHLQKACAKGGCKSATSLFGSSHESNHVEADGAEPGSPAAQTKSFSLSVENKTKRILVVAWEVGLTRIECQIHHNIWGHKVSYNNMPSECIGTYEDLTEKRLFCDVQDTEKCKRLHRLMDDFATRVGDLTAAEVRRGVTDLTGYQPEDLSLFRDAESNIAGVYNTEEPKLFDELDEKEKLKILKQTEYYFERRETGGCFMCDFTTNNRPRRDFGNLHAHHVKETEKEFGPSQCMKKSFKDGRKERRKCCPLCGECHSRVHHTKSYAEKFNYMFGNIYKLKSKGIIDRKLKT